MAAKHLPAVKEKDASALVKATEKARGTGKNTPPKEFVRELFAGAVPEDLLRYEARELAALAQAAWMFLSERKPGAPKVHIATPDRLATDDQFKQNAVLEIVNDDMPFLLDSVLGELSERGVEIRLVVHPIISVARDAAGRLTSFQSSRVAGSLRESFIHIHTERIEDDARRAELVQAIEQVLADVRVCVHDWRPMMDRIQETVVALKTLACAITFSPPTKTRSSRNTKLASDCCARGTCRCSGAATSW
jgi:glutamate dehydrogenase